MKPRLDCVVCFQRQALQAARFASDDEVVHAKVLRAVMSELGVVDWTATPPSLARRIHNILQTHCGSGDPYKELKKQCNDIALRMYPTVKKRVAESKDPLLAAIRLAIAGNIMDFGAKSDFNLSETIEQVMNQDFKIFHYQAFLDKLASSISMLYLADNAGEIVFDRILLETILENKNLHNGINKIHFVVKGEPIINDAMLQDAKYVGLEKIPGISFIEAGNGLTRDSTEFLDLLRNSGFVMSKGQGNYESLSDEPGIFFLLMTKCPVVAEDIGPEIKTGDIIMKESR